MFTCLLECCEQADLCNVNIIADGGIRSSGDMIKSLVAGADMVMIGSLLAGADEAPGDVIMTPSGAVKEFRGMASRPAMEARFGNTKTNLPVDEGIKTVVPLTGPVERIVSNLTKGIKSGMSYCNAKSLDELPLKAEWALQSMAGSLEGRPHILTGGR
jgi:IMP dehydrogenase